MGKEEEPSGCCTTVDQFGTFEGDLTVEPDEGEIELRRWRATAVSFGLLTVGYDTTVLTSRMLWTASVRGAYFLPCPKFYAIEESVSCVAVRSVRGAAIKRPRLTLRDLLKAIGVGMACYSFIFPFLLLTFSLDDDILFFVKIVDWAVSVFMATLFLVFKLVSFPHAVAIPLQDDTGITAILPSLNAQRELLRMIREVQHTPSERLAPPPTDMSGSEHGWSSTTADEHSTSEALVQSPLRHAAWYDQWHATTLHEFEHDIV